MKDLIWTNVSPNTDQVSEVNEFLRVDKILKFLQEGKITNILLENSYDRKIINVSKNTTQLTRFRPVLH